MNYEVKNGKQNLKEILLRIDPSKPTFVLSNLDGFYSIVFYKCYVLPHYIEEKDLDHLLFLFEKRQVTFLEVFKKQETPEITLFINESNSVHKFHEILDERIKRIQSTFLNSINYQARLFIEKQVQVKFF